MKSWKKPTTEQVEAAIARLVKIEYRRYFFDKLENPEWIEPLRQKGFFDSPPLPQRDQKAGTVSFPPWPESRYLARMALHKPELVANVIAQIPETENAWILEDYGDAVLSMPAEVSASLINNIKNWLKVPYLFMLGEKIGKIMENLANDGQIDVALELAKELLIICPDPREKNVVSKLTPFSIPPKPRVRIDDYQYERILKDNIPILLKCAGERTLVLLCDLLDKYLLLSRLETDGKPPEDYSNIWRPAIEDIKERRASDIEDILVSSVRDAADYLIKNRLSSISGVLKVFKKYNWWIYERIALHLIRQYAEKEPKHVAERLLNRAIFDDYHVNREYALLIEDTFLMLSKTDQEIIWSWIEKGPDLNKYKDQIKAWRGDEPPVDEVILFKKKWQCEHFGWMRKYLVGRRQEHFESLIKDVGEPRHPREIEPVETWVGPFSPKTTDELRQMNIVELVKFLREWAHPYNGKNPSPEGLGRILTLVVAESPESYAAEASRFINLDPTYIRALILGLAEAAKNSRTFTWNSVLALCSWILEQTRDIPGRNIRSYSEVDPHWGWTRKAIAELLSYGFKEYPNAFPLESRETVWSILKPITDDPDPTVEDELRFGGSNMDPATLSINTTRGQAMHVVIQYALWVKRKLLKIFESQRDRQICFKDMPEVRAVLDQHLEIDKDPSLAIRAIYGQWFPTLVFLDLEWAKGHVNMIFPDDPSQSNYFSAAWDAYIIFCNPYDNVFAILNNAYKVSIDRLHVPPSKQIISDPQNDLAEHLMVYYWRGIIEFDAYLFRMFWEKAKPEVKGHALRFIGQVLCNSTIEEVPEVVVARSKSLWESRISMIKEAREHAPYESEMKNFGWWFTCSKFDTKWAIDQLYESLNISGNTDPSNLVIEHLAKVAREYPVEATKCLKLMIKGDTTGWSIYSWREHARKILIEAIQTKAKDEAIDIINYLGSRGYHEFRDLL